jgi:hypothetical protein
MTATNSIEPEIIAEVVHLTVQLASMVGYKPSSQANTQLYTLIHNFCVMFPDPSSHAWTTTIGSALTLAEGGDAQLAEADALLIYKVLECFHNSGTDGHRWRSDTSRVIGQLLLALSLSSAHPNPPDTVLRVVLEALSHLNAAYPAFCFLYHCETWLLDRRHRAMMQKYSGWAIMGETTLGDTAQMAKEYIEMGDKLSKLPDWEPLIRDDPCGWINVYFQMDPSHRQKRQRDQFQAVMDRLWKPLGSSLSEDDDEATLIRVFRTLINLWVRFNFSKAKVEDFFRLAKCTASTALRGHYVRSQYPFSGFNQPPAKVFEKQISARFKLVHFRLLGKVLVVAAGSARMTIMGSFSEIGSDSDNIPEGGRLDLEGAAIILEEMGNTLGGKEREQHDTEDEGKYWGDLRGHFLEEIHALERQTLK